MEGFYGEETTDTVEDKLLCQIGGIVEKVLDRPLVEEDVMRLLNFLNQQERGAESGKEIGCPACNRHYS